MADALSVSTAATATVKPKPEMAAADRLKQMQGSSVSVCDVPEAGAELKWMKDFRQELERFLRPHDNLDKDIARLEKGLAACAPQESLAARVIRNIR